VTLNQTLDLHFCSSLKINRSI